MKTIVSIQSPWRQSRHLPLSGKNAHPYQEGNDKSVIVFLYAKQFFSVLPGYWWDSPDSEDNSIELVSIFCCFWRPKAVCAGESAHRNTSHPDFILRFLFWGSYLNPLCSLSMVLSINSMSSLNSCESCCLSCFSLSQGMARYLIKVLPRWPPKLTLCMAWKYIWIMSLQTCWAKCLETSQPESNDKCNFTYLTT